MVMDNLSAHKVAGVREAIRAAGASVLPLPSYSPDLNPIEHLFATFKALLRPAAARTHPALWETIGTLLDDFTPSECQNSIVNSGDEVVYVGNALGGTRPGVSGLSGWRAPNTRAGHRGSCAAQPSRPRSLPR